MSVDASTPHLPAPKQRAFPSSPHSGLVLTDYWYLLGVAIAVFTALDPMNSLSNIPILKHAALFVALPAFLVSVAGGRIYRRKQETISTGVTRLTWPLLLLSVLIVGGSLYVRLATGDVNTFLNVGIYMVLAAASTLMLLHTQDPKALLTAYFAILTLSAIYMTLSLIAVPAMEHVYHESEYLVIPMAVLFAMGPFKPGLRWLGFLAFMLVALLMRKNTAYLVALLTLIYLVMSLWLPWLRKRSWLGQALGIYALLVVSLVTIVIAFVVLSQRDAYLPSGNPDFRLYTYGIAMEKFLNSPVWGNLFTGPASVTFPLYDIRDTTNILPTHSDILDILANGGMLGMLLWLYGICRIGAFAYRYLLASKLKPTVWTPYGHTLACMSLAGILTYSFNPVLLQPGKAFLIWTNLGFLLAVAMLNKNQSDRAPSGAPDRYAQQRQPNG